MGQLLVRNLDDDLKAKLQVRARRHGRSAEEEVREILRLALRDEEREKQPLGARIAARFARIGLESPTAEERGEAPRPAAPRA